jgi:NAD(P)-dependent dehydrogenase (short-subunit alcohol dehydrogenase family)
LESLNYLPGDAKVLKLRLDVTSQQDITACLDAVVERFGRLDVLVNNAAIPALGEAEGFPEDLARALMETNFWGAATMTRESIRILRDVNPQPGGTIVQVTSIGGNVAMGGAPFYHAR